MAFTYGVSTVDPHLPRPHSGPITIHPALQSVLTVMGRDQADHVVPNQNIDNEQTNYPPQLDNPSSVNTCRIYRDVFGDCANDVAIFNTGEGSQSGEINNFGIGPCTPDLS